MSTDKTTDPNKLFNAKLSGGESRLRILLSQIDKPTAPVPEQPTDPRNKQLGTIKPRRRSDPILARRKDQYIEIYDMGQVWNGSEYEDIDFSVTNLSVTLGAFGSVVSNIDGAGTDPQTNHNAFRDKIFEIDPADWSTQYRKLGYEDAEQYGVEIRNTHLSDTADAVYPAARNGSRLTFDGDAITDTKWTTKGLSIPSSLSSFAVQTFAANWPFDNDLNYFKITTTPSYSGTAVTDFVLARKAKIFLVPILINMCFTNFPDRSGQNTDALFAASAPLSRNFWLGLSDSIAPYGFFNLLSSAGQLSSGNVTALIAHGRDDTYSEYFRTFSPSESIATQVDGTYPSFPGENTFWVGNIFIGGGFGSFGSMFAGEKARERLVGAVQQNGQTYYFWTGGTISGTSGVLTTVRGQWQFKDHA